MPILVRRLVHVIGIDKGERCCLFFLLSLRPLLLLVGRRRTTWLPIYYRQSLVPLLMVIMTPGVDVGQAERNQLIC